MSNERAQWGSRLGFVLAAAGSAVGLGNMWKFPYITGENGGGAFVLVYLLCIGLVGLPIMVGEIMIGRMTQRATVGAYSRLSNNNPLWVGVGWMGVAAAFVILSYYSVVAGWAGHYLWLSLKGTFSHGVATEGFPDMFGELASDPVTSFSWHTAFMIVTIVIVVAGVQKGVELAARVLMPTLFLMLVALLAYSMTLDGFPKALDFVFGFHTDKLTGKGVLEALGHSFFTLSLGMGALITYGSYMKRSDSLVSTSIAITILDTAVALMACLVLFPITFSLGMEPAAGPGLVFVNMPVAFAQLPGSTIWATIFFALLLFAALTSAISLLEVATAYFIDEKQWSRPKAVAVTGGSIFVLGIPSALAGGTALFGERMVGIFGRNWFDLFDYFASNWMLPLGGLAVSIFASWTLGGKAQEAFAEGSRLGKSQALFMGWLVVLRFFVPIAIVLVMLNALGVFGGE